MDVNVHNRLPGGSAVVDADVETIRVMLLLQKLTHFGQQIEHCRSLFSGCLEERGKVALWDNQRVAGGDRISVVTGYGVVVSLDDPGGLQDRDVDW